jgi:hypothetical protein
MSGLAASPKKPNKGQRKEIYYMVWAHYRKRQSKYFSPSLGYRHEFLGLSKGRIGAGKERYVQLNSPRQSVAWLVIISVLVLEKLSSLSSIEGSNLVPMR